MSDDRPKGPASDAGDWPAPKRDVRFHWVAGFAFIVLGGAFVVAWTRSVATQPSRGYTNLGYALGIGAALFYVVATAYAWRKRAGQEYLPGRLRTWLRFHVWLSAGAFLAALLHAGFHVDGGTGTWTLFLLVVTLLSGVVGWWLYVRVPQAVYASAARSLATRGVEKQIEEVTLALENTAAGRSDAFGAKVSAWASGRRDPSTDVGPDERSALEHARRLAEERDRLVVARATQESLRRQLRIWLWVHVPAGVFFLAAMFVHVFDATEMIGSFRSPTSRDFADPVSCARCHRAQYDEWIVSPHAMAQSSPVMDLQNRLVIEAEERGGLAGHPLRSPIGMDNLHLCVGCHAPTGSLPQSKRSSWESARAEIDDRAPASRYGISCVTCHQIEEIHRRPGVTDDLRGQPYRNLEGVRFGEGRTYFGPLGAPDARPMFGAQRALSIGNEAHRGVFSPLFVDHATVVPGDTAFRDREHLCASCHTVTVPKSGPSNLELQDTWREWRYGRINEGVREATPWNWSDAGVGCMSCHNQDVEGIAHLVRGIAKARLHGVLGDVASLPDEDFHRLRSALVGLSLPEAESRAANDADDFDLPLPTRRRRFRHTFTGIDTPMEAGVPYLTGHPVGERRFADPRAEGRRRTESLLRIAAGIGIERWPTAGTLTVRVANLTAGHKMPAGFAFAREMWLEVSTLRAGRSGEAGDDWSVVIGGRGDRPVSAADLLRKRNADGSDAGLRNLQAVLFDGATSIDAVLQNETEAVLAGRAAVSAGFPDRIGPLYPGEVLTTRIPLPLPRDSATGLASATRLRVRLLCRNLPPEFLDGLADRFRGLGDGARAERASRLKDNLQIYVMAEDTIDR